MFMVNASLPPEALAQSQQPLLYVEGVHVQIGQAIGAGSFGKAYRAFSPELDTSSMLAVKMQRLPDYPTTHRGALHDPSTLLHAPDIEDEAQEAQQVYESRERIMREFRLMKALREHPGVARVLLADVVTGPDGSEWGAGVMEYYEKGTLQGWIKRGGRDTIQGIHFIKDVASAVQYVHDNGFLHKDIKPENVLLSANGRAVLSDFGIAAPADSRFWTKEDRMFSNFGTAEYAAQEQTNGKPTVYSDLYSLAATAYCAFAGVPPFGNVNPVAQARAHRLHPVPSFEKWTGQANTKLLNAVEPVIVKALSKREQDRQLSVMAFAHELEDAAYEAIEPRAVARMAFPEAYSRKRSQEVTARAYDAAVAGQHDEALALYDEAISLDQINSKAHFQKAHILESLGRQDDANASFVAAYSCPLKTPADLVRRGAILARFGRHEEALAYYADARKRGHTNAVSCTYEAESMQAHAEVELLRGRDERADALYRGAQQLYELASSEAAEDAVLDRISHKKERLLGRIAAVQAVAAAVI